MSDLPPLESALCRAKCKAADIIEHAAAAYWTRSSDAHRSDYLANKVLEDFEELSGWIDVIRAELASKDTEEAA
ncbi:hypothetical protein [Roseibium album]|uniref:hypothetical protein n=1 Tax=Roseibium album TaxID=311410 RepID=UPI003BB1C564